MPLRPLLAYAQDDPAALALAGDGGSAFVSPSLRAYLLAALADAEAVEGRPVLVVAGDDRSARDLAGDLRAWLAPRPVRLYPSRGVTYESHLTPAPHLVGLRVGALDSLLAPGDESEPPVVVASAVALSEKVPDPALRPQGLVLRRGDLVDLDELTASLVAAGYERADQVAERGQFALRGGLLDVYPATEERAVRVDLFGDEVESLRWFSTFTQRSLGDAERVEVAPAAELAAEHRELAEIAALEETTREEDSDRPDIAELLPVDDFRALLDLVGSDAALMVASEDEVGPALADHWQDVTAAFHDADAHHLYVRPERIAEELDERARVRLTSVPRDQPVAFHAQAAGTAARSLREAEPELERLVRSGYRTVVAWPRRGEGERAAYNLARMTPAWASEHASPEPGLRFARATLREGFVAAPFHLAVIPEHRLLRRRRGQAPERRARRSCAPSPTCARATSSSTRTTASARFGGFDTNTVAGVTRDYLRWSTPARTACSSPPTSWPRSALRGRRRRGARRCRGWEARRWDRIKARARRAAQELAGELLNLYAERRRRAGPRLPARRRLAARLESRFPFQETADQQEAIEAVKADMEPARPMDRLICGDVGFGKTEVALRAAFKAAEDGKQVLMLVPTTILAQQHYGTFSRAPRRLAGAGRAGVALPPASRAAGGSSRPSREGQVDILIGTHRLLSRDVQAKDLGLLIVDEEQRFGVRQKELLRQLKLRGGRALADRPRPSRAPCRCRWPASATSRVIETPPEGRRPIAHLRGRVRRGAGARARWSASAARGGQASSCTTGWRRSTRPPSACAAWCPDAALRWWPTGRWTERQLEER